MGWLKRLFSKDSGKDEQPPVEVSIELSKLNAWVEKRLGSSFDEILPEIESNIEKLQDREVDLKKDLKKLEKEDLHNPKIPDRERQLMEGNRVSYVQQHTIFMQQIPYPDDLDYRKASHFCDSFEQLFLRLAKATGKSHTVMSEFFLHNAKSINKTVKKMSDIVSEMKEKMQDYDIDAELNDRLSRAVGELQAKVKHKKELEEELGIFNQKKKNSEKMREKIEHNIEKLKESDSYAEFRQFDSEKEEKWKIVKEIEDQVYSTFSAIGKPLKKFERIAFENSELIKKYLDDPSAALAEDGSLTIMSVLSALKSAVKDKKLSLKDKETDKFIERIDAITKDSLKDSRDAFLESKRRIKEIDDKMRNIRALQELNDLNYKREHVDNQIHLLDEKIDKNMKTLEKIDIEAIRKDVEKMVNRTFNVNVTVLYSAPTDEQLKKEVEKDGSD